MSQMNQMKKLTFWVNTGLLGFVAFMMWAFVYYDVTIMVYQSIPTAIAYIAMYWLVHKDKLDTYVLMTYILITAYMVTAMICLGPDAGYQLFCMSLIPLAYYMEYLGDQLHTAHKMNAKLISIILVILFLGLTWYTTVKGPLYEIESAFLLRCMLGNAIGVFCFLIGYTNLITRIVRDSEHRLSTIAHLDQLTGLFNRHYMMSYLDELSRQMPSGQWLAMIDIDGFKGINDTYGHRGGDYVLAELARMMGDICGGCVIGRWGGEEFLLVTDGSARDSGVLETLRQTVADKTFVFEGVTIPTTITIGVADYAEGLTIDRWIQAADRKLYDGKESGKNRVVY